MKAKKYLAVLGLAIAGSVVMTSCYQRNYYNTNPNNGYNNNNNNSGNYTYVFDEEFNGADNYGWSFTDPTDSAYASISGGYYNYVDYSAAKSNVTVVNTGVPTSGNFTVQTRVESNNLMGLIIGASSTDNGYAFYIDSAGNYSLYKEGTSTTASTAVIASTADSLIVKKGWNTIQVSQASGTWTGFINGSQVFSITAPTLTGNNFGYKVLPATVGYADYLTVKSTD